MLLKTLISIIPLLSIATAAALPKRDLAGIELFGEGGITFALYEVNDINQDSHRMPNEAGNAEWSGENKFFVRNALDDGSMITCSYRRTDPKVRPPTRPKFNFSHEKNGDQNYLRNCGNHGGYTVECGAPKHDGKSAACPKDAWE